MKCIIYDFETLGVDPDQNPVILAMAAMQYDDAEFIEGHGISYEDAINRAPMIKFNVVEQVKKYARTINSDTLQFWKDQGETAKFILDPSNEDVSVDELPQFWKSNFSSPFNIKRVFTRGNTFDPAMLKTLPGGDPFSWWTIRDTRSYIDGMLLGSDEDNKFIPPGLKDRFVHHHPSHDVVMDVMRMQALHRAILL